MKLSIAMTAYNQPGYLARTLESLSRCSGISNAVLSVCVEPTNPEVVEMIRSIRFMETRVTVNQDRLGCQPNTLQAWTKGFEISDFVVYMDDDQMVAPDTLAYFEYCRRRYEKDPAVFSATAYTRNRAPVDRAAYYTVGTRPWFTSLVPALWRDRWDRIRTQWNKDGRGWDLNVNEGVRGHLLEVHPFLSRVQNIGTENGEHVKDPAWHKEFVHNEFWAGLPGLALEVLDKADLWRTRED